MIVNHFSVLGMHRGSTYSEIKVAWRVHAALAHPDKGGDPERFASLSIAYEVLTNDKNRAAYLARLELSGAQCINCDGLGYIRKQDGWRGSVAVGCAVCSGCGVVDREVRS